MTHNFNIDLLPSLGFFGEGPGLALNVPIGRKIFGLRLLVNDEEHRYLNLTGIRFVGKNGARWIPSSNEYSCKQSSFQTEDKIEDPCTLLTYKGVHSANQYAPSWEINWSEPVFIDSVVVDNRPDGWGCRSRRLMVSVMLEDEKWHLIYFGGSGQRACSAFLEANRICSASNVCFLSGSGHNREVVVKNISQCILLGNLNIFDIDWNSLLQFVPLWTDGATDDDFVIVAAMALSESLQNRFMTMRCLSLMLKSKPLVRRFMDAVDKVSFALGLGKWVVTRHGVQKALLLEKKDLFLKALDSVLDYFKKNNISAVIAYGTLLGAVRDAGFIQHDDDLDVLYRLDAIDFSSAEREVFYLEEDLRKNGYRVVRNLPYGLNMHLFPPGLDVCIDVFPCWGAGARVSLHMEKMRVREIEADILFPQNTINLYGHVLPVPAHTESFLLERYGSEWHVADPYFEWPWKLEN